jgi:hypothetical protein
VDDREQGDDSRRGFGSGGRRGLDRLELAACRAVDDVPPTFTQPLADRVGGLEVARLTARDALV